MTKNGAGILYVVDDPSLENTTAVLAESTHSGLLEIPGGKQDKTDSSTVHTAVRESIEEFGLHPSLYRPMIQYIMKNTRTVALRHGSVTYVLYIVKISYFDFNAANSMAIRRLAAFKKLPKRDKTLLSPIVEMKSYIPIDIKISRHDKHIQVNGKHVRHRDALLLKNKHLVPKITKLLMDMDTPPFPLRFTFVDFDSIV